MDTERNESLFVKRFKNDVLKMLMTLLFISDLEKKECKNYLLILKSTIEHLKKHYHINSNTLTNVPLIHSREKQFEIFKMMIDYCEKNFQTTSSS